MNWTSLYFKTKNLKIFILGTGEVATRRANKFLDKGAKVILAGDEISNDLKTKGAILDSIDNVDKLVKWADIVIVASSDEKLANYVGKLSKGKLINRADFPQKGNLIVPTSFEIGGIEISIFTNGKSPLMARQLRKKIQNIITEEDILEIELQDYSRILLKDKISNQKERKEYLYQIFKDENIKDFIKNREIDNAKIYIKKLID